VKTTTILVVDDERRYRELLEMNLSRRGYRVLQAGDGLAALNQIEQKTPDLVMLDLMLPDMDGYEVCRRIREYSSVPIIMLTAKAEQAEKVRGLAIGADDYVTKPFSAEEVLARVVAVLRRAEAGRGETASADFGDLHIDYAQHRATVGGREIDLTPGEYKLLERLALNAGRVVVQDELLRRIWGEGFEGETALLQTAIRRLRSKIEADPAAPRYVLTKRGVGYWLPRS
jgi:two-component system KDP operon response regulator KdpE